MDSCEDLAAKYTHNEKLMEKALTLSIKFICKALSEANTVTQTITKFTEAMQNGMYMPTVEPGDFPSASEEDTLRMDAEAFIIEHMAELQEVQFDPESLSFSNEIPGLRSANALAYQDKLKCMIYDVLQRGRQRFCDSGNDTNMILDYDEELLVSDSAQPSKSPLQSLFQVAKDKSTITIRIPNCVVNVPLPSRCRTSYELIRLMTNFCWCVSWKPSNAYSFPRRELNSFLVFNAGLTLRHNFIGFDQFAKLDVTD